VRGCHDPRRRAARPGLTRINTGRWMPPNVICRPASGRFPGVVSEAERDLIEARLRSSSQCCPSAPLTHQPPSDHATTRGCEDMRMAFRSMAQPECGVIVGVDTHGDAHVAAVFTSDLGRPLETGSTMARSVWRHPTGSRCQQRVGESPPLAPRRVDRSGGAGYPRAAQPTKAARLSPRATSSLRCPMHCGAR
jgi:hypothetical protein